MTPSDYIRSALRTESSEYRFGSTGSVTPRMEHAIYGTVTEAGELMSDLKKSKIYGKEVDRAHLIDEMGDVMWYLALLADELGVTFEEVWEKNIAKLRVRFPEKFEAQLALERDKEAERKAQES